MHAMPGIWELLTVMLFYGGVGLPLGVPPAEQDPLMQRVAPEKCLYYTTWAGMAEPQADADNPTEALLAEPEMRELVANLDKTVQAGVAQMAAREGDENAAWFAKNSTVWLKTLITRPTAIYVTKFEMQRGGPPDVRAGLLVNTGDQTAAVRDSLLELQRRGKGKFDVKEVEISGADFYQFRPEKDAPLITWGVRGHYLLLGVGDGAIEEMFTNARTAPPAWLTALQEQLPVERTSTITYADVAALVDTSLKGMEQGDQEQARRIIAALGLNSAQSYTSVTGLDKQGVVNHTVLQIDGQGRGIFKLADAKGLTAADLATVPADSTIATALRLDGQKVLDLVKEIAGEADPEAAKQVNEGLDGLNQMLGLDLRGDVLAALGDTWCVYNSAGEGGLLFTGVTATVDIRDRDKLEKAHAQLIALAEAALRGPDGEDEDFGPRPRLKKIEFQGRTIHYLTGIEDVPFAPAWCLTDTHLVISLYPQNIEAMLARGEDFKPLSAVPEVARNLAGENGPLSVTYVDTKTLFQILYPMAKIAATGAFNRLAEEGVDIDVAILPRAETIARHLRPSVTSITRSERGIEFTSRQSLPGSSIGSSAPVAVALLLPAVNAAREAARRAQSMNNLRQIALAMHNHADAFRNFPPQSIKTKDGKPGLSWRVKILPFIEEQALYNQFRLDEPWDSEHNKKLIAQMPMSYRSPNSAAAPGYTTYLGVAGKDGIFSNDDKGTRFADIRDGLSNTLMVVEANDKAAVPWTKPDDYDPADAMKPTDKLSGVWAGGVFLAAMADGSVHAISTAVDPVVLKALFTKSGGEVVNVGALNGGGRRGGDRPVPDAAPDVLEKEAIPDEAPQEQFEPEPVP